MSSRTSVGGIGAAAIWMAGGGGAAPAQRQLIDPLSIPDTQLEPMRWSDLDGWAADDHDAALAVFRASCEPFNRQRQLHDSRPVAAALKEVCRRLARAGPLKRDKPRAFFEDNFRPVRIAKLGKTPGLIPGYYEPIVDGSRIPNPEFHTPLYRRPHDLVVQGQKLPKGVSFPNRATVGRLNDQKKLEPYHDR